MKRRWTIFFAFLLWSLSSLAANIQKIEDRGESIVISLDQSFSGKWIEAYDEDSRVLFLELPGTKIAKTMKLEDSPYVEEFNAEDYGDSVGISLRLKNHYAYRLEKEGKNIRLDFYKSSKKKLIVIDPGHGGKDPGALRGSYREKDIALAVSRYLREELSEEFEILMTRDQDVFIQLSQRPKMGNKAGAKLFVSVHVNAAENKAANGAEVYFFSKKSSPYAERIAQYENSFGEKYGEKTSSIAQISGEIAYKHNQAESIPLAKEISAKIANNLGMKNGGAHGANFAVLRGFNGPSILVEMGFISNQSDLEKISDTSQQREIARSIAEGIRAYFRR